MKFGEILKIQNVNDDVSGQMINAFKGALKVFKKKQFSIVIPWVLKNKTGDMLGHLHLPYTLKTRLKEKILE